MEHHLAHVHRIENYERAAHDKTFWLSFKNNLYIIVSMTVSRSSGCCSSFCYDYVANKIGKTAASIFRAGYYLQILPVAIAGVVWRWILQPRWGVLNWLLGLVRIEPQNWLGDADIAIYSVMGSWSGSRSAIRW